MLEHRGAEQLEIGTEMVGSCYLLERGEREGTSEDTSRWVGNMKVSRVVNDRQSASGLLSMRSDTFRRTYRTSIQAVSAR